MRSVPNAKQRGSTLIEAALLAALIAVVALASLSFAGKSSCRTVASAGYGIRTARIGKPDLGAIGGSVHHDTKTLCGD